MTDGRSDSVAISVVVPAFNECESVRELATLLQQELDTLQRTWEIIFVDDGSTDGTLGELRELHNTVPGVRALSMRRNFGKAAALSVGFQEAKGELIVTLDADLQDDPREIKNLIAKLDEGYDMISGWKFKRRDPWTKTLPSKIFNFVLAKLSGIPIHDFNCGLKIYRREVVEKIDVYGELHRFLPVLAHWQGFRIGELRIVHHPRKYGKTKFGMERFLNGLFDLVSVMFLTTTSSSPLHFFGRLGLVFLLVGALINAYFGIFWIMGGALRVRPLLLFGVVLVILGIQFVSIGLLGEMIAYIRQKREFSLRERLD